MSTDPLTSAIAVRLRLHPLLVDDVFTEDEVATGRERYVRLRVTSGLRDSVRLAGLQVARDARIWLHCIGATAEQAVLVEDAALDQLVDWTPQIVGWNARRIVHRANQAVDTDDTITPPLRFTVDQLDLHLEPIP